MPRLVVSLCALALVALGCRGSGGSGASGLLPTVAPTPPGTAAPADGASGDVSADPTTQGGLGAVTGARGEPSERALAATIVKREQSCGSDSPTETTLRYFQDARRWRLETPPGRSTAARTESWDGEQFWTREGQGSAAGMQTDNVQGPRGLASLLFFGTTPEKLSHVGEPQPGPQRLGRATVELVDTYESYDPCALAAGGERPAQVGFRVVWTFAADDHVSLGIRTEVADGGRLVSGEEVTELSADPPVDDAFYRLGDAPASPEPG